MSEAGRKSEALDARLVREHYRRLATSYEDRANAACRAACLDLARSHLRNCRRLLEVGAGWGTLIAQLDAPLRSACDLSLPMLRSGHQADGAAPVLGDAEQLPYADASFDGALSVNLLEHVPHPARVLGEFERVLVPGGRGLLVTPNGDLEPLLDLLERLRLKLPEGPHSFLGMREARSLAQAHFAVLDHQSFLVFPAGPRWLVDGLDRLARAVRGRGLFQYLLLRKPG
jgi:ubiquinone/menaquinone biosynthesis C-methylase UbiE